MKHINVNAFSVAQAKELAIKGGLFSGVQKEATQSWKNAGSPEPGTAQFEEFATAYTKSNLKDLPGVAAVITLDKGVENTRKRPYSITNIPNNTTRVMETIYVLLTKNEDGTETVHARIRGKKQDALDAIREFYKAGNKDESVYVEVMRQVRRGEDCGEPYSAVGHYSPSISENLGEYVVFGQIL